MRCLLVALLLASGAVSVHADTTTTTSVAQLMVLEPGDASYKLFHGAVWLEHDKASTNYRWGGLQCKGRELSDIERADPVRGVPLRVSGDARVRHHAVQGQAVPLRHRLHDLEELTRVS